MTKSNFLIVCLLLGFLKACSYFEVYNPQLYNMNSPYFMSYPDITKVFSICAQFFTEQEDIDYKANLLCSDDKKTAVLLRTTYFSSCYLLFPVEKVYSCV